MNELAGLLLVFQNSSDTVYISLVVNFNLSSAGEMQELTKELEAINSVDSCSNFDIKATW